MSQDLLEHRVTALEHTVGGNGQPGLQQQVDELQAVAAQARMVSSVFPIVLTVVGGFCMYFVFDKARAQELDLRTNALTDERQTGEINSLRFQLGELWSDAHPMPVDVHKPSAPRHDSHGDPHEP